MLQPDLDSLCSKNCLSRANMSCEMLLYLFISSNFINCENIYLNLDSYFLLLSLVTPPQSLVKETFGNVPFLM